MPRQPEVHFRLKPSKEKRRLIYLDFAYNRQRLKYSFGQFVDIKDWNDKKEIVKNKEATTKDGKFSLNALLENLKAICEKTYNEALPNGIPAPEDLKLAMEAFINQNHSEQKAARPTLYKLIDRFVKGEIKISTGKRRGRDKGESCLKNYNTTLTRLKDFEAYANYKVDFATITKEFFNAYVTYLDKVKELKPNTIAKDIATLKVFMNEAVDQELTNNLHFKKKSFSYSEEETESVYLTEAELKRLYKFDLSKNKKLEQARDLFIIGAFTGLRFSDYSNIKPENIKATESGYNIDIITQKTKERVVVPCDKIVLEIFEKYSHHKNKQPYAGKSISNQKFNEYIKEACKLAKFTEKGRLSSKPDAVVWQTISSHTARRSFATNTYLQGFDTISLMKITGHRTESSFLKYIKVSKIETAEKLAAHQKKNLSKKELRVA